MFAASFGQAVQMVMTWDPALYRVLGLSLAVSGSATLLALLLGVAAGAWLAVARFPGRQALVLGFNTLLGLPSVVVGLLVYLLLSRAGPLGDWGLLFTPAAMVLAQTLLTLPLVLALTRQLVANTVQGNGEQLRSMGASTAMVAALVLLHERIALVTVALTAFGRAISEVGAVMLVGGNIDGVTRVMTTSIALETSKGDLARALALGLLLLGLVLIINLALALLQRLASAGHAR